MRWALELFFSLWFGFEFSTFFARNCFDAVHRFFLGVPIGFFTLAWILFLSSAHSQLGARQAYLSFSVLVPAILLLSRLNGSLKINHRVRLDDVQALTYVIGGCFFVLLMYLSMLNNDTESRGAGYGDLPFHLNIASSFAHGCDNNRSGLYDAHSLFFSGERLAYPMLTNFLTGGLAATGRATLRAALFFPSAFMACSLAVGLFSLALEFTQNQVAALLALVLFINLGGLGFVRLVHPQHGYGDWVHNWGRDRYEYWFHPLMHVLVPQRASLWSMPLCYWALLLLVHAVEHGEWRLFLLAGLLAGLAPLVQVHSFVALAQWSLAFCALKFPFAALRSRSWRDVWGYAWRWAVFGAAACALALPQLAPFLGRLATARSQFLQINPIWRTPEKRSLRFPALVLWWRGLGAFWAMSLLGIVILSRRQIALYVPSLVVYAITNIVRYQPWELDNTKLFYAAWIPIALPVVANYLYAVGYRRPLFTVIACVLAIVACFSSFIHTVDCLASRSPIFTRHDFDFGFWISENTATKAVFLTSNWHAHPCATIAGRQLFMGYGGWIGSHGLDYWGRTNEHTRLQNGPAQVALFQRYGIRYVISRHHEFKRFEADKVDTWQRIYEDSEYVVWKLAVNVH
jgi:hypothetical protein